MPTPSVHNDAQRLASVTPTGGVRPAAQEPREETPARQAPTAPEASASVTISPRAQQLAVQEGQGGTTQENVTPEGRAVNDQTGMRNAQLLRAYEAST